MGNQKNQKQIACALTALHAAAYDTLRIINPSSVIYLVTDLRHLCESKLYPFREILAGSYKHYQTEGGTDPAGGHEHEGLLNACLGERIKRESGVIQDLLKAAVEQDERVDRYQTEIERLKKALREEILPASWYW